LDKLWNKGVEELMGGESVPVDEEYFRESIIYPDKKIVKGYGPISKMNSFEGKLTNDQIIDLISYIKYLSGDAKYDVDYETNEDGKLTVPDPDAGGASAEKTDEDVSVSEEVEEPAAATAGEGH